MPADDSVGGRQYRERRGLAARRAQVRHCTLDLGVPAQRLALLTQHPPEHQTQLTSGARRQPTVGEQPFQHRDRLGLAESVDGRPAQLRGEPNPYRPGQLGDVHRLEQEAGGGRVVAALGGQVGGRLGVADEVGPAAGPTVVVRQLGHRPRQLLLQHPCHPQVQPLPALPGHQVVHHLSGQVVAEPQAVPGVVQQARPVRGGHRRADRHPVQAEHRGEDALIGCHPEYGRRAEHLPGGLVERAQPPEQHVTQDERDTVVGQRVAAPLGERSQHLLDHERDAGGAVEQGGGQLLRRIIEAQGAGRQPAYVVGVQRAERNARDAPRGSPGQGVVDRRTAPRRRRTRGQHHGQPLHRVGAQVGEEFAGRRVRPVQILQQQRGRAQRGEHRRDGAQQAMSLGRRVGQRGRRVREYVGQFGQQWREGAGHRVERPESVGAAADRVQQHAEWEGLGHVVAFADEVPSGEFGEQFGDESALADPGLTLQQDQAGRGCDEPA
ncbi:hypothetical protein PSN01_04559 [Micromonospora saelicesensis]|nr:hypothetical protein PSN01_04559 [Micromonospora saelicesensis]